MIAAVASSWVERAIGAALSPAGLPNPDKAAVLSHRATLDDKERIAFEGQVVTAVGVNEANVLFGYRTRAEVEQPVRIGADGRLDAAEQRYEAMKWRAGRQKPPRTARRVVKDWLAATQAALVARAQS